MSVMASPTIGARTKRRGNGRGGAVMTAGVGNDGATSLGCATTADVDDVGAPTREEGGLGEGRAGGASGGRNANEPEVGSLSVWPLPRGSCRGNASGGRNGEMAGGTNGSARVVGTKLTSGIVPRASRFGESPSSTSSECDAGSTGRVAANAARPAVHEASSYASPRPEAGAKLRGTSRSVAPGASGTSASRPFGSLTTSGSSFGRAAYAVRRASFAFSARIRRASGCSGGTDSRTS